MTVTDRPSRRHYYVGKHHCQHHHQQQQQQNRPRPRRRQRRPNNNSSSSIPPSSFLTTGIFHLVTLLLATTTTTTTVLVVSAGRCDDASSTSNQVFECPGQDDACPSSGGISLVTNCLDCPNHFNTDFDDKKCFDRKLLNKNDNPNSSYLWRDIVGIVIWFFAAGLATAAGVGGGGIYVPLGILLLGFAPKPSSGLSQASIFGASLGGLLLNSQAKHPFTTKVQDNSITSTTATTDAPDGAAVASATPQNDTSSSSSCSQCSGRTVPTQHEEVISCIETQDKTPDDTVTTHYYTRPLIDYDMALFLAPMEMAGAVLGVLIQKILPNWLYLTLSSIILGFTAYKTYHKWWAVHSKERKDRQTSIDFGQHQQQLLQEEGHVDGDHHPNASGLGGQSQSITNVVKDRSLGQTLPTPHHPESESSMMELDREGNSTYGTDNVEMVEEGHHDEHGGATGGNCNLEDGPPTAALTQEQIARRTELLERDARQYPTEKIFTFVVLWIGLTLLIFLKGGKGVESLVGITCESPWYGVLIGLQFLWTLGFAAFFGWKLMKETKEKESVQYPFHPQDVLWDFQKTRFYAFFTFLAGIVAGLIGIGGGMVLGPLMLVMGIHPRVSTATTATMIVLTSSSVAVLFVTSGLVPWEYAVCFFFVCFCGALVGKLKIDGIVKRTGKASILVFLLATIIAFATIGTLTIVLVRLAEADWCFAGFNQFCKPATEDDEVTCKVADRLLQMHLQYGKDFYNSVMTT